MARSSSSNDRSRSTKGGTNPAIVPGVMALVLIVVAVFAAVMTRKPKEDPNAATTKPKPFADMPPEELPPPKQHKPGSNLPDAPDGLLTEPLWVEAKALAAEARLLYDETVAAKTKGDLSLAAEKGVAARLKYDKAAEMTAEWEESLLSKFNERDPKVSAIKSERTDWFNKMNWLKKSVGH
ncbi:MAG: hypothetical protein IPK67_15075 [Planctomycetes bacterium]|nr:hypothetical protein [Planctomycetota bacterium]